MRCALRLWLALLLALCAASASAQTLPKPGPKDLCPVCGMLVSKYPNWAATVVWKDGHAHHLDGAKDMFKFLLDLPAYAPGHQREQIAAIGVTDFYNLAKIDAREAWYVTGSDVLGPMGHELVPLASGADAEEFLKDHKGKRILRFEDVTTKVLAQLDSGKF
ncbi:MAG: nitrous oxide reductase accessory protein NosL [Proteobacteria bacterium]|nr:nitrous oxide reductase accessory protein NosL [Pseudomonadota bacterium]